MPRQAWGTLEVKIRIWEADTDPGASDTNPARLLHSMDVARDWSSGTTPGQIDRVWSTNAGALPTPGVEVDLVSTAGIPSRLNSGQNCAFGGGVVLLAVNHLGPPTAGVINVGGASANAYTGFVANASDIVKVEPDGGLFLWLSPAGSAPVAGTADLLKVMHAAAGTTAGQIIIAGRS